MPTLLLRLAPQLGFAALLAIISLGVALKVQDERITKLRGQLVTATALHETDLANVRAAQARANADQRAQIDRLKSTYRSMKNEADRQTDRLSGDFAARVLRLPATAADPGGADAVAMPGALAPRTLTDPVEIPSFLRDVTR